jgi:hypothetical protein
LKRRQGSQGTNCDQRRGDQQVFDSESWHDFSLPYTATESVIEAMPRFSMKELLIAIALLAIVAAIVGTIDRFLPFVSLKIFSMADSPPLLNPSFCDGGEFSGIATNNFRTLNAEGVPHRSPG